MNKRLELARSLIVKLYDNRYTAEETLTCCRLMSHDVDADDVLTLFSQLSGAPKTPERALLRRDSG